jgi:hypothetical protein
MEEDERRGLIIHGGKRNKYEIVDGKPERQTKA